MRFVETRGNDGIKPLEVTFSEAILSPSASFGGLYIPKGLPKIDEDFIKSHIGKPYKTLAFDFLKMCGIDIEDKILQEALNRYDLYDDSNNPVPLSKIEENCFVSELYHGPTRAFKDMALQPFGYILSKVAQKLDKHYLIMAATSGDTGPATLETFKNQPNVQVVCLYPDGGTSDVQRLQMVTEEADNLFVVGVRGDFDDTQNALKELLASDDFNETLRAKHIELSAANSVNFGRIIFQIIYHIYSYITLLQESVVQYGDKMYVVVPSGNFGNALGAYYAKKMGLPIEKILITSNANNILTEWINNGSYDMTTRELVQTISPAMDILKSSNVERILFDKFGATRTKELMEDLAKSGKYSLNLDEIAKIREDFEASFSSDEECLDVIRVYAKKGYIMDPHTATCIKAYKTLEEKSLPTIICSTAEWTKFSPTVAKALGKEGQDDEVALKQISNTTGLTIPQVVANLFDKKIKHDTIVDKDKIKDAILAVL